MTARHRLWASSSRAADRGEVPVNRDETALRAALSLIHHEVPSPVSPGEIEMSGVFDWPTLCGIADAVLAAVPRADHEAMAGRDFDIDGQPWPGEVPVNRDETAAALESLYRTAHTDGQQGKWYPASRIRDARAVLAAERGRGWDEAVATIAERDATIARVMALCETPGSTSGMVFVRDIRAALKALP